MQGKKKYNNKKRLDLTEKTKNDEITIFFLQKTSKNSNKKIKIKSDR